MRKIGYDIFIGGKPKKEKKPTRLPYIIILAVIAIGAAGFFAFRYAKVGQPQRTVIIEEKSELKIYYPSPQGKLIAKTVQAKNIALDKDKADAIMANLKSDRAIPETLSLIDIASDGEGTLILNFTPEMTIAKLDPLKEIQMVYCIINSFLANFTKAKRVQILAGGQALATLGGTVYIYKPLEFNANVLED